MLNKIHNEQIILLCKRIHNECLGAVLIQCRKNNRSDVVQHDKHVISRNHKAHHPIFSYITHTHKFAIHCRFTRLQKRPAKTAISKINNRGQEL